MKRNWIGVLISLLLIVASSNINAQSKPLKVACDIWPPYQIKQGKEVTGYSTKIVEAVFNQMGKAYIISSYPWKRALKRLELGNSDALFSAGFSPERKSFSYYPDEPIFESIWVMWVRKEDKLQFSSYDDLKDKKVGVVRGYSYTEEFWKEIKRKTTYEEVSRDELNFKKLNANRVDYIVAELGNGYQQLKDLDYKHIIPLKNNPIKIDRLYILFNKKNISLKFVNDFSKTLKRFKSTDAFKTIHNSYF